MCRQCAWWENVSQWPGYREKKESAVWFEKAAEKGDMESQYDYCLALYSGKGIEADIEKAIYWAEKAAEKGHARAQAICGEVYLKGIDVKQDKEKGIAWLTKAAEQGNADVQFLLGRMYWEADTIPHDMEKACDLLEEAAAQGKEEAKILLEKIKKACEMFEEATRLLKMEGHFREGLDYLHHAAKVGHSKAQFCLGQVLYEIEPQKRDILAFRWYEVAARRGNEEAKELLVLYYAKGEYKTQSEKEVLVWLEEWGNT